MNHSIGGHLRVNGRVTRVNVLDFAAVETVEVREERWELLREAQWSLRQWERHRRDVDRQRLVGALRTLAALMREAE